MKIICIKSYHESNGPRPCNYNIGKTYILCDDGCITDDNGRHYWWRIDGDELKEHFKWTAKFDSLNRWRIDGDELKEHFKLLEDIREERINEILS